MKYLKRILHAVLFFAGLYCLLLLSSQFFLPKNNTEEAGMEDLTANGFLAEKENSIDVLFLGDSEVHRSVIPMQIWKETGITSYDCSSDRQVLSYSFSLLKRAVDRQKPKIVFLETDAVYREHSPMVALYNEVSELFPIFRYHDRWKKMSKHDLTLSAKRTWRHYNKGYKYAIKGDPSTNKNYIVPTDEKEDIPKINIMYTKMIKDYCDSIGAKFVLLSTPSTINWNYKQHNGLKQFAEELGCDYIDMNLMPNEVPIDWDIDTFDKGNHLNYRGAVKVTNYLTKYITETGLCKSHKGDPEYAQWDEDYKQFEEQVNAN